MALSAPVELARPLCSTSFSPGSVLFLESNIAFAEVGREALPRAERRGLGMEKERKRRREDETRGGERSAGRRGSLGGGEGRGEGREERRGGKRKGKDAVGGPGRQWAYGKTPAADEDLVQAIPLPKF